MIADRVVGSRIFVTGGDGFVGRHLVSALQSLPEQHAIVVGVYGEDVENPDPKVRYVPLDITDSSQVQSIVADQQPTHLFHLAGIAAVSEAQRDPRKNWAVNFQGALNIALAVREVAPDCRLVYCSSAEVYGDSFRTGEAVSEAAVLDPVSAYGASKAAADIMIGQMARDGLRAVRLRPVNHTGPGQKQSFVVPAFAAQIAAIERGEQDPVIKVGNLTSQRDFLDVRDVVDAYVRTIARFDSLPSGCALNIASGRAISIGQILECLLSLSSKKIEVVRDPSRVRRNEIPVMLSDASAARKLLDWVPRTEIITTLSAVLAFHRNNRTNQYVG
jgi:GDP-4-dehydro-6-deoxy-D-mannose reductase